MFNKFFGQLGASIAAAREAKREIKKLEEFFQPGRILRDFEGRVYRVLGTRVCTVFLQDKSGQEFELSWLKPSGEIRKDVTDHFRVVQ